MSNFEDSTVTYTTVSSPFIGLSDIRSPGVDGPPVMLEDPYAYVVAAFQAPPSPDYVPGGYLEESLIPISSTEAHLTASVQKCLESTKPFNIVLAVSMIVLFFLLATPFFSCIYGEEKF
nr:hypothetical protein [Tanacetum cinerariifolium]